MIPDMPDPAPFAFTYRNWRGEIGERRAIPIGVWFSSTEWHPEPQWLLRAYDCDKRETRDFAMRDIGAMQAAMPAPAGVSFQDRVQPWMMACFGPEISGDKLERGDRLLEEVLELLQSVGYPRERIASLSSYVWSRPKGEPAQEVGGSMVTLAAFCLAHDLDMHAAGETELARIWTKVEAIRAKQAAKPTGSALPVAVEPTPAPDADVAGLFDVLRDESWDLRCFSIPTAGGDDADIGWRVIGHWMAEPCERVIAEWYGDDPAAAVRAAVAVSRGSAKDADADLCPICLKPLEPDDLGATDITEGICHAACLEGSPVVDLETGEETGGKADTYRYGDDATRENGG